MAAITLEDVWRLFAETDRLMKAGAREVNRRFQETERQFKETDRKRRELGRQIGGLGNQFGSVTEGLALPSLERLLRERFGMTVVSPRVNLDGRRGD